MDWNIKLISGCICVFIAFLLFPGQESHYRRAHNVFSYAYVGVDHGLHTLNRLSNGFHGHGYGHHGLHGLGHHGLHGVGDPFGKGLYGLSGIFTFNNRTILCGLKGGVCAPPTSCVGKRFFVCDDGTSMCCINSTFAGSVTVKKIIYEKEPIKKRKRKRKRKKYGRKKKHNNWK